MTRTRFWTDPRDFVKWVVTIGPERPPRVGFKRPCSSRFLTAPAPGAVEDPKELSDGEIAALLDEARS